MPEKLILNYENFEDSPLSEEFDTKGGMKSFTEYVAKNCNCICSFIPTDNQEDMSDDSWSLKFKDQESLSDFCIKYNFSIKNDFLIKEQKHSKLINTKNKL